MLRGTCAAQWGWGEAAPGWPAVSLCLDLRSVSKSCLEPAVREVGASCPGHPVSDSGLRAPPDNLSALWLLETHQILWLAGSLLPLRFLGGF